MALVGLASCSTLGKASPEPAPPPVNGMIYDWESRPVADARISVDGALAARSDINGRFAVSLPAFGPYRIEVSRDGFESVGLSLDYCDRAQVVYLRMASADELRDAAEDELERQNWAGALALLDRVESVAPGDWLGSYLRAVIGFRKGDYEAARKLLDGLYTAGCREAYLYLLRADLEQYYLDDPVAAARDLAEYLDLRYDPDVEARLKALKDSIASIPG